MEAYSHRTALNDKLRAKNLLNNERQLLNMYNSITNSEKEGTIKRDMYNMLSDEREILEDFQSEIKNYGWM